MRKTIFLDRDGVINRDSGYVYKVEDFEFMPNVLEDLIHLHALGFQIIIITNQSGIARGYYTARDYKKFTKHYLSILKKNGIKDVKVLYCPHHPDGKIKRYSKHCKCRKPEIGLFEKAIKKYDVDISQSFVVGDRERDLTVSKKYKSIKPFIINSESNNYPTINRLLDIIKIEDSKDDINKKQV